MTGAPDHFAAPLGPRERWATLAAVVLGTVGVTGLGVVLTARTGDLRWLFVGLPFTVALLALARRAPMGYRLAADGVHVERRAGPAVIPYRAIRTVDRHPRPLGGLSLLASQGIFGRFGRFWNATLGVHRLFLTNTDRVVWLSTQQGWVALSPDRPDEFMEALRRRLT
jgi:hypothetical protein